MRSTNKIYDRQIGRNAQLFAESLSNYDTKEARYPYIRILVSIIEQAHPEWNQAPTKDSQIAHLAMMLSGGILDTIEVAEIVRVRDEERGLIPPQIPAKSAEEQEKEAKEKEESKESSDDNSTEMSSDKSEDSKTEKKAESKDDSSDDNSDEKAEEKSDEAKSEEEESSDDNGDQEESNDEK